MVLFRQILYFDGLAAVLAPDFAAVAAGAPRPDTPWADLALGDG